MNSEEKINVWGARVHNLKNIDVEIPRDSLTVITGLSGSGKSSLAFDTIFAEGQRRYIETFSAYARNFLGNMERPDVDKITGLSPVISIEQKTTNKNPRSTVGTTTEIYDYLRLLYARAGTAYSYQSGEEMMKYTEEQVIDMILSDYKGKAIFLLAPLVRQRKGHYRELFESMRRKGYLYVRLDGNILEIVPNMKTDRYKNHNIEAVVDKLVVKEEDEERIRKSVATAMKQGDGMVMVLEKGAKEAKTYSKRLMDPVTGIAYQDPAPNMFSFNSPEGACPHCKGLGKVNQIDIKKVIPDDKLSIHEGGIAPLGKYKNQMIFWQIESLLSKYDLNLKTPICEIPGDAMQEILYGSLENVKIEKEKVHTSTDYFCAYDGIIDYLQKVMEDDESAAGKKWADQFISTIECPECHGLRLKKESLSFKIWDKNISEVASLDIDELRDWLEEVEQHLPSMKAKVAHEIIKELRSRVTFLLDVGLNYLSLNRQSASLSGGESQRIRLATQIGSQLVNVLYILDEPSIGLHPANIVGLTGVMHDLVADGNSVILVDHDTQILKESDWIIEMGPEAGAKGGRVIAQGTVSAVAADPASQIGPFLSGAPEAPLRPRAGKANLFAHGTIRLSTSQIHTVKPLEVAIPKGRLTVVTGVSGSGKTTMVLESLIPALEAGIRGSALPPHVRAVSAEGIAHVKLIDATPIGINVRSTVATYAGVHDELRKLYARSPDAKARGCKAGDFSYNTGSLRCPGCDGTGVVSLDVQFLPDVSIPCPDCRGSRYARAAYDIQLTNRAGQSVSLPELMDMDVNTALPFCADRKTVSQKLQVLQQLGLGYLTLGEETPSLSGGEAQRLKLASEIGRIQTDSVFVFDEPSIGLHPLDVRVLLGVFQALLDRGATVVVIEHDLDVIRSADYVIDMGPGGGDAGGRIVAAGTPEEIRQDPGSITGRYL